MFLDRSRKTGRYLEWKVRLFTLGAVLAVVGMAMDQRWMTWVAIVFLLAGLVLRFLPGGRERMNEGDAQEEGDHPSG